MMLVRAADAGTVAPADIPSTYGLVATKLVETAITDNSAFERLAELCDRFGPRFSGTTNLEAAIDWVSAQLRLDGLDKVHSEPVMIPRWVRGHESIEMIEPRFASLRVLGLGGSIGTGPEGLTAEVLVVQSFDDLHHRGDEAKGKIVLFDEPFSSYGKTVAIRSQGAIEAAKAGAVASLVRSVTPHSLYTLHTGMMRYEEGVRQIPHAAITVEDAELLERIQARGQRVTIHLRMEAHTLPDVPSRNVVAEITGREHPEEVVLVGGHIDSWDVGQGAMDDGGGCLAAWQALRLLRRLDLHPRRTVRLVLWVNEENGLRGAQAYHDSHRAELNDHVLAIESDMGVARPLGFSFSGNESAAALLRGVVRLTKTLGAAELSKDAGGSDLIPLRGASVPTMELVTEGAKYFWYHHTDADTIDKIDRADLNRCAAALAVMCYTVADMPTRLPR